ncbi:MAG: nickel-responsive transcriptional regulator NikR [Bacteroidales bacterium]|nr:nickel-responsive transcriptional regulator NikR [Bacteroidales bacterium]
MSVIRFGVSLEQEMLDTLDEYSNDNQLANRSQAIRHLINNNLVEKKWQCNHIVAGSITLVYDHHKHDMLNHLTQIQHKYFSVILSSLHFHLNHDKCMEIIAIKGKAVLLTKLADELIAVKGIQHGKLTMSRAD